MHASRLKSWLSFLAIAKNPRGPYACGPGVNTARQAVRGLTWLGVSASPVSKKSRGRNNGPRFLNGHVSSEGR